MQSSSYFNLLTITAESAADTAHICYRKARRDCYRIHALLTHPRTVEAAKIAIWCLYLGAVIAFTLGQTARILVDAGAKAIQQWAESEVAACIATEPAPIADPAPAPAIAAPVAQPVAVAQPVTVAVVKVETETATDYSALPTPKLRQLCSAAGIRWKDARGKNRHMTKAAMIAALEVASAAA